jgi:predicted nucleotidyltransferase
VTLPTPVTSAIAALDPAYADVLQRVTDALQTDSRIVALWLGGSVGRGVADAGSDLDLIVTVRDAEAEELLRGR